MRTTAPAANLDPSKLTGAYMHYTQLLTVALEGGTLEASMDGRKATLAPTSGNCFAGRGVGTLCFVMGESGKAAYIQMGGRALARRN